MVSDEYNAVLLLYRSDFKFKVRLERVASPPLNSIYALSVYFHDRYDNFVIGGKCNSRCKQKLVCCVLIMFYL